MMIIRALRISGKALLLAALCMLCWACKSTELLAPEERIIMIPISGGTFPMGDFVDFENPDATPVHTVTVADFHMAATETTFAQYDGWARRTGRELPPDYGLERGRRAVVGVSWHDALAFCEARGYRLPSEAEWEYAAREGGRSVRWSGTDDPDSAGAFVRHLDNGEMMSTYVGTKEPNALGLFDMSGNVFEWVGDYYEFYPVDADSAVYKDMTAPGIRILRGGSVRQPLPIAQTWWRSGTLSSTVSEMIGFRCADS